MKCGNEFLAYYIYAYCIDIQVTSKIYLLNLFFAFEIIGNLTI